MALDYASFLASQKKPATAPSLLYDASAPTPDFSQYKSAPVVLPQATPASAKTTLSYQDFLTTQKSAPAATPTQNFGLLSNPNPAPVDFSHPVQLSAPTPQNNLETNPLKQQVIASAPFTDEGKKVIQETDAFSFNSLPDGIGGTTTGTDVQMKPGQPVQGAAYEAYHTFFSLQKIDPVKFNAMWDAAAKDSSELKNLDNQLSASSNAKAYMQNGENVTTDPYALAQERYSLAGAYLGLDGLSQIPKPLQVYYSKYLSDGPAPTPDFSQKPAPSFSFNSYLDQAPPKELNAYIDSSVQQIKDLATGKATLPNLGVDIPIAAGKAMYQGLLQTGQATDAALHDQGDVTKKIADFANIASGVAATLFSPVTGVVTTLDEIPGARQIVDLVNVPFTLTGLAGAYATGKVIDVLPIAQESKDVLKAPLQQLGSTLAQLFLGGKIMEGVSKVTAAGNEITPEISQQIVEHAKEEAARPMVHPEDFTAPTPSLKQPSLFESLDKQNAAADTIPAPSKSGTTQTLKPIEGTGAIKPRGLSQGVEATAIEKKLTDTFGDLPEFQQVSMKDQAVKAAGILSGDYAKAKAIAMGDKAPPKGVLPESVFVAVEHKATAEGDVATLKDLANSKLSSSATTMGQRIRTLGERDAASPVGAIKAVQDARTASAERRYGDIQAARKVAENEIPAQIRKMAPSKVTWAQFVDSVTC